LLALERGYYDEPREATLDDLAGEVGISRQAYARRLRRGYRTLIQAHLQFAGDGEDVT
jgi:predicted DNA binding protein